MAAPHWGLNLVPLGSSSAGGEDNIPIASGAHDWENRLENGIWTYALEDVWKGLQDSYQKMAQDVQERYGVTLETTDPSASAR